MLELLPYVLHAAAAKFPTPKAEYLVVMYTHYMISMYCFHIELLLLTSSFLLCFLLHAHSCLLFTNLLMPSLMYLIIF